MLLVHISNILRGVGVLLTKFSPLIYGLRKSGASQAFNYNQHLAEKQKKSTNKKDFNSYVFIRFTPNEDKKRRSRTCQKQGYDSDSPISKFKTKFQKQSPSNTFLTFFGIPQNTIPYFTRIFLRRTITIQRT